MTSQKHIIYRQILEISYSSKKEAKEGQDQLSRLYRRDLMSLISEVFDKALATDDHIRIDRLEIDLGTISPHNLEEEIRRELRSNLEDELFRSIQKAQFIQQSQNGHAGPTTGDEAYKEERPSEEMSSEEVSVRSPERSEIELFTFFVRTGQLPWWAGREQARSLEELATTLIENQPSQLLDLLLELIPSETYRRRLIYQFPDHILLKFIELKQKIPDTGKQIKDLHEDFYQIHKQKQIVQLNQSNFRLLLWQCAFDYWLSPGDYFASGLKRIITGNWNLEPVKSEDPESDDIKKPKRPFSSSVSGSEIRSYLLYVVNVLVRRGTSSSVPRESHKKQSDQVEVIHLLLRRIVDLGIQSRPLGKMIASLADLSISNIERALSAVDPDQIKRAGDEEHVHEEKNRERARRLLESEDSFEINNAGLVIIAPFLPRFFDNLGLVSEKSFVTEDAARRAALLLQYIVTEQTEMAEYNLMLNKLLCDLPIEEPISRELEISDPEREEVENLLQSVVEHWEALKGTSTEGLRETFLIKEGLLNKEVNGWRLRVERTTVDVLLDRLPWSISIIKLPWNEEMIHVEW